jgi:molybdopterin synthase sulfur carrier subunit
MRIEVALYAGLTQYLPSGTRNQRAILEVRNGATVREVMKQLGMPPDIRGIPVLGGKRAAADAVLKEGETLAIFPPLGGGGARRAD